MTVKVPQPRLRTTGSKILHLISTDVNAIETVIGREDTVESPIRSQGQFREALMLLRLIHKDLLAITEWRPYMKETWNCLLVTLQTMEQ